jgi:hypothetical protein
MPSYWEIVVDTPIAHGSDILNRNAIITFIVNPATGQTLNVQPTGTVFAWRTANQICFRTNYLVAPFLVAAWQSGVISITTPAGVINKTFTRLNFVNNNH